MGYGGSVTFTATANAGFTVDTWSVDGLSIQTGGAQYALRNITANHAVKVTFKPIFTITPSAGAYGSISPNSPQKVGSGSSVTFTATANAGYTVDTWSVDGFAIQTGGAQYALKNITANHAVKVTFKAHPVYQPDLGIANSGETTYTGYGTLNLTGAAQSKSQTVAAGVTATYYFQVQNTGTTADSFTLTCPLPSASGWTVQFIDGAGKDITTAITGTGGKTALLAVGVTASYTLHVTPSSVAASAKPYSLLITAVSTTDATKKDAVDAVTTKQ